MTMSEQAQIIIKNMNISQMTDRGLKFDPLKSKEVKQLALAISNLVLSNQVICELELTGVKTDEEKADTEEIQENFE